MINIYQFLLACVLATYSLACYAAWPTLPIPENSRAESIGESVTLNGVPIQMYRIISKNSPSQLEKFYQDYFGENHTKTAMPNGVVLAQASNTYFTTVRISDMGNGLTEVLTSVSDGQAAKQNINRPLGFVLPAKSELMMDMESSDAGKNARQLVFNNRYSIQANADFLINVLQDKGYILQPKLTIKTANSISLMFGGNRREARLVVSREGDESNAVVTTILSQ